MALNDPAYLLLHGGTDMPKSTVDEVTLGGGSQSDDKLHEFQIIKMKNKHRSCSLGKVYVPAHVGVSATENEVRRVR